MPPSSESFEPTDVSTQHAQASGGDTRLLPEHEGPGHRPSAAPAVDGLRAGEAMGRYLVLEQLGSGGMSIVYVAYDPELDRRVALKVMRPDGSERADVAQTRLLREAQAMARLAHRNVVRVYDVGVIGERVYLAMELIDGVTLRDWISARPRGWRELVGVLVRAGRGLAAAHEAGLVHLDFKPRNVLVGSDGEVRVADFGLARLGAGVDSCLSADADGALPLEHATQAGMVMGTPGYMAPEQLFGDPPDPRSDQFAFCVTAWEALYGQRPFPGRRLDAYREALAEDVRVEPPASSGVPVRLRRLLERGLSLDPARRHPSLTDLLDAMADDPARRWRQLGLGTALLVTVTVGTWGIAQQPSDPCKDVAGRLVGVWDDERRAEVRDRLAREDRDDRGAVAEDVVTGLDAYASSWLEQSRDACVAAREHRQSAELTDLREYCLLHRRGALRATVDLVLEPSSAARSPWQDAVHSLPPVERCRDGDVAQHVGRPPDDPLLRESVERIDDHLSRVWALVHLGRPQAAVHVARPALRAAEASGHPPLVARVKAGLATALTMLDRPQEAERLGYEAMWAAEAAGMPGLRLEATSDLIYALGVLQGRFREAENLARGALVLERELAIGPDMRAQLLSNLASVYATEGRAELARDHYQASIEITDGLEDAEALNRTGTLSGLGATLLLLGEPATALERFEQALAVIEQRYDEQHAAAFVVRENIATALLALERHEDALATLETNLAASQAAGRDERTLATLHATLGAVLLELHRFDEARTWLERARRSLEDSQIRPLLLGVVLGNLATADLDQGWLEHTAQHLDEGQRILSELLPDDHLYVAWQQVLRARFELAQGRPRSALEHATAAYPVLHAAVDPVAHDFRAEAALVISRVLRDPAVAADPTLIAAAAAVADDDGRSPRGWAELAVHEAERGGRSAELVLERARRWLATLPVEAEASPPRPEGLSG